MCIHTDDPILKMLLAGSYKPLLFNFNKVVDTIHACGDEFSVLALVILFLLLW